MIRVVDGLDTGAWMGSDLGSSFLFFNWLTEVGKITASIKSWLTEAFNWKCVNTRLH
jgi:hypothetical protein